MSEILSQDEIDALLSAISTGEVDIPNASDSYRKESKRVKIYDFRRPNKFSKENIFILQQIHEVFSRLSSASLSAQLQTDCRIHVVSVDQLTYEEFIRSIPNPTAVSVINLDPLKGSGILEIDPKICFAILSYILGASEVSENDSDIKKRRELTDIEFSIMEGIVVRLLGNLRESWSNVLDLRPRLGNIETNPMFCQIVPPDDMCVVITLECMVGDIEGMINLLFPFISVESVLDKLKSNVQYSYAKVDTGIKKDYSVFLEASIHNGIITLSEIENLKIGSIIELPKELTLKLKQDNIIISEKVL
jgi:flagellar motor switch protein FliM